VAERMSDEALASEALALKAMSFIALGRLDEARGMLDESIQIARRLGHQPALMVGRAWRGLLHYFQSEYTEAEEELHEALELSTRMLDAFMVRYCLFFLGLTRANEGRISDALELLEQVSELARRNGDTTQSSKVYNCIGWIYREVEALEPAIALNRAGVEHSRRAGLVEGEVNSEINLVHDYAHSSCNEESSRAIEHARQLLQSDDWLRWRFTMRLDAGRAKHCLSLNDIEQAESCARCVLAAATRNQAHKYIAVAHHLLGQVEAVRGDREGALTHWEQALEELRLRPSPLTEWRIRVSEARLLVELGDEPAARDAWQKALQVVNRIAAGIRDASLRTTFLASVRSQTPVKYPVQHAEMGAPKPG
jgi:tetratricopeptide (TPR) repeat protein